MPPTQLIRFDQPPAALSSHLPHPPFDIHYGTVEVDGKPMLVAIWRRVGVTVPFEAASADFIRDLVYPLAEGVREVRLPYENSEVESALRTLI